MFHPSSSVVKDYDTAELDIFKDPDFFNKYLNHAQLPFSENRNQTLDIFPSEPTHAVDPSIQIGGSTSKGPVNQPVEVTSTQRKSSNPAPTAIAGQAKPIVKMEGSQKATTSSSERDAPKTPDPKTLRRLAQNREAARKSRLRKKAYIQQLESGRIRLSQLEQEVQLARSQSKVMVLAQASSSDAHQDLCGPDFKAAGGALTAEAAMFDAHYKRWLEEHHNLMCQLRAALEDKLPENQLQLLLETALSHHEVLINLKGAIAKSDILHLTTGTWMSPAERCFLWIGGHRPGELIKIVLEHIGQLAQQQTAAIHNLQQSVQAAEDVLNQSFDAAHRSFSEILNHNMFTSSGSDMANFMTCMPFAMSKLTNLEPLVRQADSLRFQTLVSLHQILTIHQSARCFLIINEYFYRLRAFSIWVSSRSRQVGF